MMDNDKIVVGYKMDALIAEKVMEWKEVNLDFFCIGMRGRGVKLLFFSMMFFKD